ncbi:YciI family protein [Roseomonas sp. E05]|uniref:YciI family protein n=1 Tax=Roseomonas sp. E05 TaxID=3046310 RepID=UPI0024B8D459|nr:YciI family protein [Roseomonas sp. E05]MDJ0387651.1 YciI family protein [Roseomonas sp. E05]
MLFAIIYEDKPGVLDQRAATRPAHLEYLTAKAASLVQGGAMLDAEGKPCGSLILVEAPDLAAAEKLAAEDPYVQAGLFQRVTVRAFRQAFANGAPVSA